MYIYTSKGSRSACLSFLHTILNIPWLFVHTFTTSTASASIFEGPIATSCSHIRTPIHTNIYTLIVHSKTSSTHLAIQPTHQARLLIKWYLHSTWKPRAKIIQFTMSDIFGTGATKYFEKPDGETTPDSQTDQARRRGGQASTRSGMQLPAGSTSPQPMEISSSSSSSGAASPMNPAKPETS